MPQPFVNITAEFAQLSDTHTILTPNERLAREYHFAFDRYQRADGLQGWHTLRCMSLNRYLQAELQRTLDDSTDAVDLVSSHTLLNHIVQHAPLKSVELAQSFADAWQTMHRYDIDIYATEFGAVSPAGKSEIFHTWFEQVSSALQVTSAQQEVLLPERIGDWLCEHVVVPRTPLLLTDFEQLTAVERRYIDYAAQHVVVSQTNTSIPKEEIVTRPADGQSQATTTKALLAGLPSLTDEVAAAAAWAYEIKRKHKDARIGIVVPNLAQHYELVQRQCAAILDPAAGSLSDSFDLSAGTSLHDQPVWRHAQRFLTAIANGLSPDDANFLGHSPYFKLTELSAVARKWPRHLPRWVKLEQLLPVSLAATGEATGAATTEATGDATAETTAQALTPASLNMTGTANFSDWVQRIRYVLEKAGWPQISDLNSNQYQAVQAILQVFERYQIEVALTRNYRMGFEEALQLLGGCLQQSLFAPQRPHSDILVLGLLETTGLSFSHLWVCGLDENSFPAKSIANPFLPRAVAKRYAVPRHSQADELSFARRQLSHWYNNSEHLHFSYSMTADDNDQLPSPLLTHVAPVTVQPPTHPYLVATKVKLERYVDTSGTPVDSDGLGGGTGLLRDQAVCPFKAYAQYRLGLKRPKETGDFPNALVRGNLLHDALFEVIRTHSTQTALLDIDTSTVAKICNQTVSAYPVALPELFAEREITRLTNLILAWLVLECARQPFETVHLEESFNLELAGLQFRIRVDRIDRMDEQLVVIDYKTGKVSMTGVTKTPTQDPQLPAYSLIDEAISGVYYAEIREEPRLIGIAAEEGKIDGSRLTPVTYAWPQQRRQWRDELNALAGAFAIGQAAVEPQPGACTYCHLSNLCRINSMS